MDGCADNQKDLRRSIWGVTNNWYFAIPSSVQITLWRLLTNLGALGNVKVKLSN